MGSGKAACWLMSDFDTTWTSMVAEGLNKILSEGIELVGERILNDQPYFTPPITNQTDCYVSVGNAPLLTTFSVNYEAFGSVLLHGVDSATCRVLFAPLIPIGY